MANFKAGKERKKYRTQEIMVGGAYDNVGAE
jgi:hypothetical protein